MTNNTKPHANNSRPAGAQAMSIFGFFAEPGQQTPAYDPGLTALCPHCLRQLDAKDVRTYSLMLPGDVRSFFYRVHKSCDELATDDERSQIESALVDTRATSPAAAELGRHQQ